jgi:DNA-binding PadR family transcriptional regulator
MTSSLGYALLGLLARAEGTGYDLTRRMDRPIGYFWTARHSQIYPELARLEADRLVRHRVVDGAGPLPTKRYAITPGGLRALREWVTSPMEPHPVRDLETLRVYSLWAAEPQAARALVERLRAAHLAALEDYGRQREEVAADPASRHPSEPLFSNLVALEAGVRSRTALVEWCDWLLARLDEPGV